MVVFVQSYPNLINTLFLIKNNSSYKKTTICVINNFNLYNLLKSIKYLSKNNIEIKYVEDDEIIFSSFFAFIRSYINVKIKLKNIISDLKFNKCDIFFFSKAFTTLGFYLLKNNKTNNQLIHIPDPGCDVYTITDKKPKT